jgi:signal transduction histidine kinase
VACKACDCHYRFSLDHRPCGDARHRRRRIARHLFRFAADRPGRRLVVAPGFGDVELTAVAETVADAYRPDAEEAGHALTTTISQGIVVSGDKELLTQALANLVENALRHTPPGTRIDVRLEGSPETDAHLSVEDDGPGVAVPDLPHLTARFYRGETSRTTAGNGLGLSLVSAVAELHGARLDLSVMKPGLRVTLSFPLAESSSHQPSARSTLRHALATPSASSRKEG